MKYIREVLNRHYIVPSPVKDVFEWHTPERVRESQREHYDTQPERATIIYRLWKEEGQT